MCNSKATRPVQKQRAHLYAAAALLANTAYALYNGFLGIWGHSIWFLVLCAYYLVLSTARFLAITRNEAGRKGNHTRQVVGRLLVLLALTLGASVYLSARRDVAHSYPKIAMISIATYTAVKVGLAISRLLKGRRENSLETALRNIGCTDALASVLSLQRSMLASFGEIGRAESTAMNAVTGTVVSLVVLGIGLSMNGTPKRLRKGEKEMATSKFVQVNRIIERAVVGAFQTIQNAVVTRYTAVEDWFVRRYLTGDGETVADAKRRLKSKKSLRSQSKH